MACCAVAAYFIYRLVHLFEKFDISVKVQLNDSFQYDGGLHNSAITTRLTVLGMTCAACSNSIERSLLSIDGVTRARASVQLQHVTIVHYEEKVSSEVIKRAIEDAGFDVPEQERSAKEKIEELRFTNDLPKLKGALIGSMTLTTAIIGFEAILRESSPVVSSVLSGAAAILLQYRYGWWIHDNAWRKARGLILSMDTLISISVLLSLLLSFGNLHAFGFRDTELYYKTSSALIMIVSGGRYLDLLSRRKASDSTASLYGLVQETAMVKVCSEDVREAYSPANPF